jgi:hypothetical protein
MADFRSNLVERKNVFAQAVVSHPSSTTGSSTDFSLVLLSGPRPNEKPHRLKSANKGATI